MTENAEKSITPEESVDEKPFVSSQPQVDFVLQAIVTLANDVGIGMGVTLCVGGIVVSGVLISGKQYFAETAKEVLQASGPADQAEVRQSISDYMGNFGKLIYERAEDDGEAKKQLPGFIHLSGAKFYHNSGQPMPANRGILWRGRLSAVDGFSFGALS